MHALTKTHNQLFLLKNRKGRKMKYIFLISLIFINPHIIPMDRPPQTNTQSQKINDSRLNEIVNIIDTAINKKYPNHESFFEKINQLSKGEGYYYDIIAIIRQCYPAHSLNITVNLLNKLRAKNSLFGAAMDYFIDTFHKSFAYIMPEHLDTCGDHTKPTNTSIDMFDESVKKYILEHARNKQKNGSIKNGWMESYTIPLSCQAQILSFDICSITHMAAISTQNKQNAYKLSLWNLTTGALQHTSTENGYVVSVCFNADGSQLAAIISNKEKRNIKIWDTLSKNVLHTIEPSFSPESLTYMTDNNHMLCTSHRTYTENRWYLNTSFWSTEQNKDAQYVGSAPLMLFNINVSPAPIKRENYSAQTATFDLSTLEVQKLNCHNVYLCRQAIENATTKKSLSLMPNTNPFKLLLTPYEQGLVKTEKETKEKNKWLQ
jgi:hypothetical protein